MELVTQIQNGKDINIKSSNKINEDYDTEDIIDLPRKITLFRVVMDRKLGIDREHPELEIEESVNQSFVSL